HLLDDLGQRRRLALHRAGQRVAAQGAEADGAHHRRLAVLQRKALVIDHQDEPVALHRRTRRREIERHDGDVVQLDILPDVELGPVADREDADALAPIYGPWRLLRIVEVPQLGPLVLGVPAMARRTEGEDAFLGAALLLVPPRTAEGDIETVEVE